MSVSFCLCLCLLLSVWSVKSDDFDNDWKSWDAHFDFSAVLDDKNKFKLYWSNTPAESGDKADNLIEFGMEVVTNGWAAIGISPNGKMPNSDIMLAFVDESTGKPYLYNMHTLRARERPHLDTGESDLQLLYGERVNGKVRFRFSRPAFPCNMNDEDRAITMGTTRLIYAWSDTNPVADDISSIVMHSTTSIGMKSINLARGLGNGYDSAMDSEKHVLTHDIMMKDHKIRVVDTTYFCTLIELPKLENTHHIIKMEPLIQAGMDGHVHHIQLYLCPDKLVNKSNIGYGEVCKMYDPTKPSFGCTGLGVTTQLDIVYVWAVGMGPSVLPPEAGIDLGGKLEGSMRYAMLEMHYNNPDLLPGLVDSSGFRIYYTPDLRDFNVGTMGFGIWPDTRTFMPEGLATVNFGYCMSDCTKAGLPPDGVTVFSSFLHQHTVGYAINLRHIRNGIELPVIDSDWAYDFDFQKMVSIDKIKFLPGDDLILECYTNNTRKRASFGGLRTSREMCVVFLWVFPKPKMIACTTAMITEDLVKWENGAIAKGYLNKEAKISIYDESKPFNYDISKPGAIEYYNRYFSNDVQTGKYRDMNMDSNNKMAMTTSNPGMTYSSDQEYMSRYLMCFTGPGNTIWDNGKPESYHNHIDTIPEVRLNFQVRQKTHLCYHNGNHGLIGKILPGSIHNLLWPIGLSAAFAALSAAFVAVIWAAKRFADKS